MTKATAVRKLVDRVCGVAVNEKDVPTDALDKIVKRAGKRGAADPEFLAYFAGMQLGSTAVARRWIERNPASALVYAAGVKTTEKYLKSKSAA